MREVPKGCQGMTLQCPVYFRKLGPLGVTFPKYTCALLGIDMSPQILVSKQALSM